jgi:hypothetical protein
MYTEHDGDLWLQTSGTETALNCVPDSGIHLFLSATNAGAKSIYATLLAAEMSDLLVDIRIVDGSSPCQISYIRFNRQ